MSFKKAPYTPYGSNVSVKYSPLEHIEKEHTTTCIPLKNSKFIPVINQSPILQQGII